VAYIDRAEQAQQEQLDWLHEIHEQSQAQTELLRRIARYMALIYGLAIVCAVLGGIWLLAGLFDAVHG
jgi:hypothetical protein